VAVALLMVALLRRQRRRLLLSSDGDATTISKQGLRRWSRRMRANTGHTTGEFLELSQGRVHYILRRPFGWREAVSKPTVVLFHGFGMFSFVYQDVMEVLLEHGYSVLGFDWYGHGYSESPDQALTVSLMVQQARELIEAVLGPTAPVCVLGHSMGGLLAAAITPILKDRMTKLILVCPAGTLAKNLSWRRTINLSIIHGLAGIITLPVVGKYMVDLSMRLMRLTSVSTLTSFLRGRRPTGREQAIEGARPQSPIAVTKSREQSHTILADMMKGLKTVTSDGEVRRDAAARFNNTAAFSLGVTMHLAKHQKRFAGALTSILSEMNLFGDRTDVFAACAEARIPTLVFWGDQDEYIPIECCDVLRKIIPAAQFQVFKGADHFVFLNKPVEFCSTLTRFLAHKDLGKAMSSASLRQ
jgi:pimeloyl-ACP methyl ester carboxylesterase